MTATMENSFLVYFTADSPTIDCELRNATLCKATPVKRLSRQADEPLEKLLTKIEQSLKLKPKKTKNKKNAAKKAQTQIAGTSAASDAQPAENAVVEPVHIAEIRATSGRPIESSDLLKDVFQSTATDLVLSCANTTVPIFVNAPRISKVSFNIPAPKVNVAIFPKYTLQFCDETDLQFAWHRTPRNPKMVMEDSKFKMTGRSAVISTQRRYVPTAEDLHHKLTLIISATHQLTGFQSTASTDTPDVELHEVLSHDHLDFIVPYRERQMLLPTIKPPDQFRIATYNILHTFPKPEHVIKWKHYSIEAKYIDNQHRMPMITDEIIGLNPDVISVQELTNSSYADYILPELTHSGYSAAVTRNHKETDVLATFFKTDRYKCVREAACCPKLLALEHENKDKICEMLGITPESPMYTQSIEFYGNYVRRIKETSPKLYAAITKPGVTVLVTTLEDLAVSADGKRSFLIVANCHLSGNPILTYTRSFQVKVIHDLMVAAEHWLKSQDSECRIAKFVACDMNAGRSSPNYQYFLGKDVSAGFGDPYYDQGNASEDEVVKGYRMNAEFALTDPADEGLKYTTCNAAFSVLVDYVLYDAEVVSHLHSLPQPSHDYVVEDIGMPSRRLPSDHFAQVSDFLWKT